jgi:hypothetical protein
VTNFFNSSKKYLHSFSLSIDSSPKILVPTRPEHILGFSRQEFFMLRCLLALGMAFVPAVAYSNSKTTCTLAKNDRLQEKFGSKKFEGFFRSGGKKINTVVTLNGQDGNFTRQGTTEIGTFPCIRYFSIDEVRALSGTAEGLSIDNYIDNPDACAAAIIAEWTAGGSKGRVLWCVPAYVKGAVIEGVYWSDEDWQNAKYTDEWDGHW